MVKTSSAGSYPRIGDTEGLQKLRRAYTKREVGEISEEEFKKVEDEFAMLAIKEQESAGLDIVTDGQIRWYDQISHLAKNIEGVKINGLLRFFDTNTYFRQPVIEGEMKPKGFPIADEFKFAKGVATKTLKAVLTGPYTLAKLSKTESFGRTLEGYTEYLKGEMTRIPAEIIQIDEPAILKYPDVNVLVDIISELKNVTKSEFLLHVYFGDPTSLYEKLLELPCDSLGLDFTYSKNLVNKVAEVGSPKPLMLGIFDGRSTYIETDEDILPILEKILPRLPKAYVSPSCGLEYLPREFAHRKLKTLVAMVQRLQF